MTKQYTVPVEQDENGELMIVFPDQMMEELKWQPGDTIEWIDNNDNTYTLQKKVSEEKQLVLVETICQYRMRYCVEVPKGKSKWALDTVTMEEAKELSQHFLGEQIVSDRVITESEYFEIFDRDNQYLENWSKDKKLNFITKDEGTND
jgi:bifunctional DNA-binding transcriptional regulator/antitoxin component of YhaV-PrlF toxin-antitoxin module